MIFYFPFLVVDRIDQALLSIRDGVRVASQVRKVVKREREGEKREGGERVGEREEERERVGGKERVCVYVSLENEESADHGGS